MRSLGKKSATLAAPAMRDTPYKWLAADFVAAAGLFAFVLATNLSTVLNNAYSFGGTLYDSAIFQTIIWRSGWALRRQRKRTST